MNILYSNLNDIQFEELVIEICFELLGSGVQGFVTGSDGGRDARYVGRCHAFPSASDPWEGTVVIQVKHTELVNKSFSESDFSGKGDTSILGQEIRRIAQLVNDDELDFYILFANRRLTGVAEQEIRNRISQETGLGSNRIRLVDTSELDRLVKRFPDALKRAEINPAKSPPDIDPNDLAEVITRLARYKEEISDLLEGSEPPPEDRISPERKNKINGLRTLYFNKHIRPRMVDFKTIRIFLGLPENQPYVKLYEETANEIEAKIDAWRASNVPFERFMECLIERFFARDFDLRKNKRLTRTVIYYMYCTCDIGNIDT